MWSAEETTALFHLRSERELRLCGANRHHVLWNQIANEMMGQGVVGITSERPSNLFLDIVLNKTRIDRNVN